MKFRIIPNVPNPSGDIINIKFTVQKKIYIMAGSLNKVLLIGRLGNDPEIKQMQNGKSVARLSVATSESWKDKNSGERRDKTEWHRVVIFNEGLVRIAEQYLKKGSKVYLEGQLQTRKWEDKDGIEKYTTEVVLQNFNGNLTMLGGRSDNSVSDFSSNEGQNNTTSISTDMDDDIPF